MSIFRRKNQTAVNKRVRRGNSYLNILAGLLLVVANLPAQVITSTPELQQIDVQEHSGETIPQDLVFTNSSGQQKALGQYFSGDRPVALVLAYYNCPMLCTLVLNGLTQAMYNTDLKLGQDYQVLTVSIDPTETVELAASKKATHLRMLQIDENNPGWEFFVGKQDQIDSLAGAIGFKYFYVEERQEYAHPAVVILLTPQGKISRYLYGIEFNPRDLKLGLLEASKGTIGSTIEKLILYCYHYDPDAKGYVVLASNVMKLGGLATLIILGLFLGILWLKDSRRKNRLANQEG